MLAARFAASIPDEKSIFDRIIRINNENRQKGVLIGYVDDPQNIGHCLDRAREDGSEKVGLLVKGLFEGYAQHLTPVYYERNERLDTEYFVCLDPFKQQAVDRHFVEARSTHTVVQFYSSYIRWPTSSDDDVENALNILVECFEEPDFIGFCKKHSASDPESGRYESEQIFQLNSLPHVERENCQFPPIRPIPQTFPVSYAEPCNDCEEIPQGNNRQFWGGVGLVASGIVVLAASSILLAVTCGAAVPGLLVSVSLILTMAGVAGGLVGVPLAEARNGSHAVARKAAGAVVTGGGLGYVAAGAFGGPAGLTASNVAQVTSLFGSTAGTTAVGSAAFISTMVGVGAGFFAAFVLIAEGVRRMRGPRVSQSPSTMYGRRQPLLVEERSSLTSSSHSSRDSKHSLQQRRA